MKYGVLKTPVSTAVNVIQVSELSLRRSHPSKPSLVFLSFGALQTLPCFTSMLLNLLLAFELFETNDGIFFIFGMTLAKTPYIHRVSPPDVYPLEQLIA